MFYKGHVAYVLENAFKNITDRILVVFIEKKLYFSFQIKEIYGDYFKRTPNTHHTIHTEYFLMLIGIYTK